MGYPLKSLVGAWLGPQTVLSAPGCSRSPVGPGWLGSLIPARAAERRHPEIFSWYLLETGWMLQYQLPQRTSMCYRAPIGLRNST